MQKILEKSLCSERERVSITCRFFIILFGEEYLWELRKLNVVESRMMANEGQGLFLKAISRKFTLLREVDLKIFSGFFIGERMPRFKKFGCFESGNFKTVNYVVIG